jgi:hypothetical protein
MDVSAFVLHLELSSCEHGIGCAEKYIMIWNTEHGREHAVEKSVEYFLCIKDKTWRKRKCKQDRKYVIHSGIQRLSTCVLCKFWMLLDEIKNNTVPYHTIPYIYYASVTISIIHIRIAVECRRCKNISVPLQHKVHSLTLTYLSS